ncbi:MAG TPA: hypothetical protein VFZ10_19365 [Geminicoccaceae bacterium]
MQLARILASTEFKAAERNHRFLRYIVEEALAGRGDRIKAYSIAVEVLGRDASFDPQSDPVVRIEASRLRRSLEHYYIVAGRDDPIRIEIPKGGYVPEFTLLRETAGAPSEAAPAPEAPAAEPLVLPERGEAPATHSDQPALPTSSWRIPAWGGLAALGLAAIVAGIGLWLWTAANEPEAVAEASPEGSPSIIVLPFQNLGGEPGAYLANGMVEEITTVLAQFDELFVYSPVIGARYGSAASYEQVRRELGVRYVLEGSIREAAGRVRVTARLVDAASGAQVWASAYEEAATGAAALFELQSDIARSVVIEVAQPYGVIAAADMELIRGKAPESLSAYECVLQVFDYYRHMSPTRVQDAHACLERATETEPGYADAWALLGMSHLDHVRLRLVPRSEDKDFLDRALQAARKAVELAPRNALAHQALLLAHSFRGEVEQAVAVGDRAVALSPNNSDILATHGLRLALSGQWERGLALVQEAIARTPAPPGWYHTAAAVNWYRQGRYDEALEEAVRLDAPDWIYNHVILAMIYGQLGQREAAAAAVRRILEIDPEFAENVWYELRLRNLPPAFAEHVADGLRKAGLRIPSSRRTQA